MTLSVVIVDRRTMETLAIEVTVFDWRIKLVQIAVPRFPYNRLIRVSLVLVA